MYWNSPNFFGKEKGESDIARGQKDVQFRKTKQAFPKYYVVKHMVRLIWFCYMLTLHTVFKRIKINISESTICVNCETSFEMNLTKYEF
jgi:hypothetical protein